MGSEREQEGFKKEPIRVRLGEELKPFEGIEKLDDLEKGKTPDVFFTSDPFYLEGVGKGKVVILEVDANPRFRLLDLSNNIPQIIQFKELGRVNVHIDQLDQKVNNQPDIVCTVRVGNLELRSTNQHLDAVLDDGAMFYDFSSNIDPEGNDLVMHILPQNLKQLILRFDPNLNPPASRKLTLLPPEDIPQL